MSIFFSFLHSKIPTVSLKSKYYYLGVNKGFMNGSRLVIENAKRKKNARLTPSMNLSSMTVPDHGTMCPNFWLGEN